MFKLSLGDLLRGLLMAILASIMVAFITVLNRVVTSDFDVFSFDFIALMKELTNVFIVSAYGAGSGYLIKNLLTSDDQKFLGKF